MKNLADYLRGTKLNPVFTPRLYYCSIMKSYAIYWEDSPNHHKRIGPGIELILANDDNRVIGLQISVAVLLGKQ